MNIDTIQAQVLARYAPRRTGGLLWPFAGLAILGLIIYRMLGQTSEERLITIVFVAFLVVGIGIVALIVWLFGLRAIEVMASGTIDFVSRARRESFLRTDLVRVEGRTTFAGRSNTRTYRAYFILIGADRKEIRKNVVVPIYYDPALQEFVRQLERFNPGLDVTQYWAWSQKS